MTTDVTFEILHQRRRRLCPARRRRDRQFLRRGRRVPQRQGPRLLGPELKGKAAIRSYFEPLFANAGDVKWHHTNEFICGDRAVTEWHRTATLKTGERQEWLGCDLYTFRRGLIVMKDTYIKVVV